MLGYPLSRLGYPVTIMRLFGFFLTLFFFSFLLYAATLRHDQFTSARQLYLPAGIITGALSGFAEAKVVTKKLKEDIEIVAWSLLPIAVLWALPFGMVLYFFGSEELLPFATYFLLPSIPAALGTSSLLFRRFEKKEHVQVFMFVYGYKFWIETPQTLKIELYGFLEAVADKNTSWMLYYGKYAEKLKRLVEKLSERIDKIGTKMSEIKELTTRLLDENMKFYRKGIRIVCVFVASCVLWIALMMFAAANNYFDISQKYGTHVELILFGMPFLLIFVYPFIKRKTLTRDYEKTVQNILGKTNLQTQTTIKDVLELMEENV